MIRKYLGPIALILAITIGFACAQALIKSVQLSQDPSGPIQMDSANNVYFPKKLLSTSTVLPALTSCGTSPSIVGNDTVGKLTTGSGATTCTLTFATAYNVAPACVVSTQGAATQMTFTTSTTALTATVDVASTVYNYICLSQG